MAVGRWLFAAGVAVSAGLSSAQHDETETEVEAVSEGGGHVATHAGADSCIPVLCTHAGSHDFHSGTDLQTQMEAACHNVSMFNFMKNETEQIEVTCQACTPNSCAMGDHNCVPVFCTDQHGTVHGGHSNDPCQTGHHSDDGLAWWPFLLACMLVSIVTTAILKKLSHGACCGKSFNPPFTVLMFTFGFFISSLAVSSDTDDGSLGDQLSDFANQQEHLGTFTSVMMESVLAWKSAHPHVILFVLLPPLLFEDAASMDYYVFKKVLASSCILAGPGVLVTMLLCAATTMALFGFANECVVETDHATGVTGVQMHVEDEKEYPDCFPRTPETPLYCRECIEGESPRSDQLPVSVHLLLGGMLAATDPVAVCAVLNDLGCPNKLNYLIAGESLLNDGTAVVAFLVMQSVAGGCDTSAGSVMYSLAKLAGGGTLWGLFMAMCTYQCIKSVNDPRIEITALMFSTATTFWVAENIIGVSGVLGTVVFGVQSARTSFLAMDEHTRHANHAVWGEIGYIATCMIFVLAGVKAHDKMERFLAEVGVAEAHVEAADAATEAQFEMDHVMWKCVVLWIILGMIRALVVAMFSPLLKNMGYGLTKKEAIVMVWGGLRGAVSLSLALLVDGNHLITPHGREMIFMMTVGIVALTLFVNGTTAGMVYKMLQVYPTSPFESILATQGLRALQTAIHHHADEYAEHWFFQNADSDALKKLLPDFSDAHLFDGDLVEVKMDKISETWNTHMQEGTSASPFRMGLNTIQAIKDGTVAGVNIARMGYSKQDLLEQAIKDKTSETTGGGHHASDGDSHGSKSSDIMALQSAKKWVEDAKHNEVDADHALYGIMIRNMHANFNNQLAEKEMSVECFTRLNAACGLGGDINDAQIVGAMADAFSAMEVEDSGDLAKEAEANPEEWKTPLDGMVNSVITASKKDKFSPIAAFHNKMLCAEMLMSVIDALDGLDGAGIDELGEEFAANVKDCLGRARLRMASMQAESPNQFQAAHTLLAYRNLAAHFGHMVHEYEAQGFFDSAFVQKIEKQLENRQQELGQFLNVDNLLVLAGLPCKFFFMADHPVVYAYYRDKAGQATAEVRDDPAASLSENSTANPVAEDEEENTAEEEQTDADETDK